MSKLPHLLVTIIVACVILFSYWAPVSNRLAFIKPENLNHVNMVNEPKIFLDGSYNTSLGYLWPSRDEISDRIENQVEFLDRYRPNRTLPIKTILRVGDFNFENWNDGQKEFIDLKCPITECSLTKDRKFAKTADVLLISEFSHDSRRYYLPKAVGQIWIAQHWESAVHDRIDSKAVHGLINWTASYRREATVPISYGKYRAVHRKSKSEETTEAPLRNYAKGKTKKVAWIVSNCGAKNNRYGYAHELAKHISVDIYGWCGWKKCPRDGERSCKELLKKDYKFYLAFENSNCKDYITEKLTHNAFKNDILPIVMGARREDYAAVSPPRSYLHVSDFSGPRDLAAYLHILDSNDTLYNTYFEWRRTWEMMDIRYWCRLCMLLHLRDEQGVVMWYDDYHQWWNGVCSQDINRCQVWVLLLSLVLIHLLS